MTRTIRKAAKQIAVSLQARSKLFALTCASVASAFATPAAANGPPSKTFDVGTVTSNYKGAGGGSLFLDPLDNSLFGESHDIDTGL